MHGIGQQTTRGHVPGDERVWEPGWMVEASFDGFAIDCAQ